MKYLVLYCLMLFSLPAEATDRAVVSAAYVSQAPKQFLVSGVLRKGTAEMTIRLVHSIHTAATADEALGIFTRQVMDKFPGYSILTTLVTEVEFSKSGCDVAI